MATWAVDKVKVNRMAVTPEDPMVQLAAKLQEIEDEGYASYTVHTVRQDITDSSWVVIYSYTE